MHPEPSPTSSTVLSLRPPPSQAPGADKAGNLPLVLLRDLHHRMANVLHFAGLQLDVQARRSADGAARAALREVSDCFRGLIDAHMRFAISDLTAVGDAGTEVNQACRSLARAYSKARPEVRFDCLVDAELRCAVRPAGVLSLIVNELVTNAYKHAFRGRGFGYLLVTLAPAARGRACLSVVDDGPGFDKSRRSGGAGMGIVDALADAIDGEVAVSGGGGSESKVRVTFPPLQQ